MRSFMMRSLIASSLLCGGGLSAAWADDLANNGDDNWEHIDELADRMANLAEQLHGRIHQHLEGHEFFQEIDEQVDAIEAESHHIHEIAHQGGNIQHLQDDLGELDAAIDHANDVITRVARRGVLSQHYDGAIRQTRTLIRQMDDTLHHMEEDLAELNPGGGRTAHRPIAPGGVWGHINGLATDLALMTEDLHDEAHRSLEADFHFAQIDAKIEQIEALTTHIQEVAGRTRDVRHLRSDVNDFDIALGSISRYVSHARNGVNTQRAEQIIAKMREVSGHFATDLRQLDPHPLHQDPHALPHGSLHGGSTLHGSSTLHGNMQHQPAPRPDIYNQPYQGPTYGELPRE